MWEDSEGGEQILGPMILFFLGGVFFVEMNLVKCRKTSKATPGNLNLIAKVWRFQHLFILGCHFLQPWHLRNKYCTRLLRFLPVAILLRSIQFGSVFFNPSRLSEFDHISTILYFPERRAFWG